MKSSKKKRAKRRGKRKPEGLIVSETDPRGVRFVCSAEIFKKASDAHGESITEPRIAQTVREPDKIFKGHGPSDVVHEKLHPELDPTERYIKVVSQGAATTGTIEMNTAYSSGKTYGKRQEPDGTHPKVLWRPKGERAK